MKTLPEIRIAAAQRLWTDPVPIILCPEGDIIFSLAGNRTGFAIKASVRVQDDSITFILHN
jgi:hypothetical protein